jgi:hypothetical protein
LQPKALDFEDDVKDSNSITQTKKQLDIDDDDDDEEDIIPTQRLYIGNNQLRFGEFFFAYRPGSHGLILLTFLFRLMLPAIAASNVNERYWLHGSGFFLLVAASTLYLCHCYVDLFDNILHFFSYIFLFLLAYCQSALDADRLDDAYGNTNGLQKALVVMLLVCWLGEMFLRRASGEWGRRMLRWGVSKLTALTLVSDPADDEKPTPYHALLFTHTDEL